MANSASQNLWKISSIDAARHRRHARGREGWRRRRSIDRVARAAVTAASVTSRAHRRHRPTTAQRGTHNRKSAGTPASRSPASGSARRRWRRSSGATTRLAAVATAARAVERGIRLFDSAPLYGLGRVRDPTRPGAGDDRSRRRRGRDQGRPVARRLAGRGEARRGVRLQPRRDVAPARIEPGASRSRPDRHRPHPRSRRSPDGRDRRHVRGTRPTAAPKASCGAVSLGTNVVETARFFLSNADLDCVMVAGRLTLLDQSAAADLVAECRRAGVAYLAAGVFNSGVLADPQTGLVVRLRARVERRCSSGQPRSEPSASRTACRCAPRRCTTRSRSTASPR